MTNRQWLESLSDDDFAKWLTQPEERSYRKGYDGRWREKTAQPSPRLHTLKEKYGVSLLFELPNWMKEERDENGIKQNNNHVGKL